MKSIKHLLIFLLISFTGYSQTNDEKVKIVESYDQGSFKKLSSEFEVKYLENNREVENYLLLNNLKRKIYFGEAGIMEIRRIVDGKPLYYSTDNINSARATRTNFLHNGGGLGLNLEGQDMHIATWDGGPTLSTHQEFLGYGTTPSSRVTTPDLSSSNDQSNHSTHVSGTIIAKGTQANAKGMAPRATLTSFDWDNDEFEALTQANTNGLLLSNHSYGIPVINQQTGAQNAPTWMMGCYDTDARAWDQIAVNAPYYLAVVSAGNDGQSSYTGGLANNYDKLTGNKNSKNNLVVANGNNPLINPNGSGQLLSLFINSSSSQGPTDDGRIKPDITGDGTNLFSPISTSNTSYATYSGTSMSAPNVAGSLLLLQQYYNQLNSQFMKSATLKALVCHTADDDSSLPGPDPIFGWGLLNSKRAVETILMATSNQALILESNLSNGGVYTKSFSVSNAGQLSATICWTDPAGSNNSGALNSPNPALINDLDLRITNVNNTFFPWKLQLSNVAGQAIKADNLVDNIENVDIDFPVAGNYTITVSHKGNLSGGSQPFSLVLTGTDLTLSENDFSQNDFSIWPNPSNGIFNISLKSNGEEVKINIHDLNGRLIHTYKQTSNSNRSHIVDLSHLSSGIYLLTLTQGQKSHKEKIVIK